MHTDRGNILLLKCDQYCSLAQPRTHTNWIECRLLMPMAFEQNVCGLEELCIHRHHKAVCPFVPD